jgi:hypothetical protein
MAGEEGTRAQGETGLECNELPRKPLKHRGTVEAEDFLGCEAGGAGPCALKLIVGKVWGCETARSFSRSLKPRKNEEPALSGRRLVFLFFPLPLGPWQFLEPPHSPKFSPAMITEVHGILFPTSQPENPPLPPFPPCRAFDCGHAALCCKGFRGSSWRYQCLRGEFLI